MSDVDISRLRIDDDAARPSARPPLAPRLLLAAVVVLTIATLSTFVWPLLQPTRAVRMTHVRTEQGTQRIAAQTTTEAVGWVEADPYATIVRPLVSGHVETLEVLEGARVVRNETVVARMVSADLLAARDRAVATLAERRARKARADADLELARARLEQNATALLRMHEARTGLATIETQLASTGARLEQAEQQARGDRANAEAQERLAEAGGRHPIALERARAARDALLANVEAIRRQIAGLQAEREQQRATLQLCTELAADPVDLRGAVALAEADAATAAAELASADTEREIAERELAWAVVRSPVDGIVLRLEAEPGDMVGHGAKGVVAVYDPNQLRARIDVPLDSITGIRAGQRVELTSEVTGDRVVTGVVQRLQHETDILKNTLQVKVGLDDPPALWRPETLCRARFLAADDGDGATETSVRAFRVPGEAVRDGKVFVFDPSRGTARAVAVEVLSTDGSDRIVRGELSPTQRIVLDPVTDGEAIEER